MPYLETQPGVMIHWEEAGTGRPVVFVHGWSMSSRAFSGQQEALEASNRVIAVDLRGHGRSSCEKGAPAAGHAIEDHARDLAILINGVDIAKTMKILELRIVQQVE